MNSILGLIKIKIKLLLGKGVYKSYSQFGEDSIAHSLLRDVKNGTYIDVGAFDPVLYSNTYHFYKNNWRGLVIDPNPKLVKLYRFLRPHDTFINVGIGDSEKTLTYYAFNMPAYNTFDINEKDAYLASNSKLEVVSSHPIQIQTLDEILREHKLPHIDFLSVDVQGMDLQVLMSLSSIEPTVIAVEDEAFNPDKPNDSDTYRYLKSKSYEIKGLAGLTTIWKKL